MWPIGHLLETSYLIDERIGKLMAKYDGLN